MFKIITVPEDAADLPEQLGTKPKFWFQNVQGVDCLFKESRQGTGEDWSEKVAGELCRETLLWLGLFCQIWATAEGTSELTERHTIPPA